MSNSSNGNQKSGTLKITILAIPQPTGGFSYQVNYPNIEAGPQSLQATEHFMFQLLHDAMGVVRQDLAKRAASAIIVPSFQPPKNIVGQA